MSRDFELFFRTALGEEANPYSYQSRLSAEPWPDIVNVPTGMGKTAAIVLSWLYKRNHGDPSTPRRLVYCLPMRVLVEQTANNARKWIERLLNAGRIPKGSEPQVHVLMGGDVDIDWDLYPERDAILVGTQDQLLSRALNRGYSMIRFRWPIQFGLLNNDALWVMDEVQLMGSGLATSVQLQVFRSALGTVLPTHSVWMSATLAKQWLSTVDLDANSASLRELRLSREDEQSPSLKRRYDARKILSEADCPSSDLKGIAQRVLAEHQPGSRTLVVVNTVKRAQGIFDELTKKKQTAQVVLLHSRFRPPDRRTALERLLAEPTGAGTICVATQVVEAGVDVSCDTLFTDLAPWASLVQRFGRCNRDGLSKHAKIFWMRLDLEKKNAALPYTVEELHSAINILQKLKDAAPRNLPPAASNPEHLLVLRKKDLFDLFDTTPELAGADIDISRFIRDSEDHDVQVFWRDIAEKQPSEDEPEPARDELCSVSVGELRSLKSLNAWRWDHLEEGWGRVRGTIIFPGMVLMLRMQDGNYSAAKGWTGDSKDIPDLLAPAALKAESNDDDWYSQGVWQSLADHNDLVVSELEQILLKSGLAEADFADLLFLAARWHDTGKAHPVFQRATVEEWLEENASTIWAKTAFNHMRYERRGFRHELASALAMLQHGLPDLAIYLAAAHHGKVRLSIRSLPNESKPGDPAIRFARGIWDGDILCRVDLGGGHVIDKTELDLSPMEFGDGPRGPSWLARTLALRDNENIGPFRLAYLESLLRAADRRASMEAISYAPPTDH